MKTKMILVLCCFVLSITGAIAQDKKTDTIKVWGNCGECKEKIEGALKKKDGILSKSWNKETKMLVVTYNPQKISIKQIGEKIAAVGYDNDYATAAESSYNKLDKCCQYQRPKKSSNK